jgi:hypothetical protein
MATLLFEDMRHVIGLALTELLPRTRRLTCRSKLKRDICTIPRRSRQHQHYRGVEDDLRRIRRDRY